MDQASYDFLDVIAGLAVTFVGLATIAIILSQEVEGHPSRLSLHRTRTYAETGLCAAGLAVLPGLLSLFALSPEFVWRLSGVVALVLMLAWYLSYPRRRRRAAERPNPPTVWVNTAVGLGLTVGPILVVTGLAHGAAPGCYAIAPLGMLLQNWANFVRNLGLFGSGR